jgi:predicted small metal-binding protein
VPTAWAYTNTEEDAMARIIRCECGFVAHGRTDGDLIDMIRDHMSTDHPALLETVTEADLLGWIKVE